MRFDSSPSHGRLTTFASGNLGGDTLVVLLTGSEGLIGYHLAPHLRSVGLQIRPFDIRRSPREDITNHEALRTAMRGVAGIVHLAAVSRVVWGELDPEKCVATNVTALEQLLRFALEAKPSPWVLFVSSREVYGMAHPLPVHEDAKLYPMNTYARSKCEGERLVREAMSAGLPANIARLSSVYGWSEDHVDRVVPAFAATAARGGVVRIDDPTNVLDITHVQDVVRGLATFTLATARNEVLPAIHFVSGCGTTLGELAELALRHAAHPVSQLIAPGRTYDVNKFVGNPLRAKELLGWTTTVPLEQGFRNLVKDFSQVGSAGAETSAKRSSRVPCSATRISKTSRCNLSTVE